MKRISFFLFFLIFPVYAQEFDASVEFTAQGQGYWIVTVDGEQVSQHTTSASGGTTTVGEIGTGP